MVKQTTEDTADIVDIVSVSKYPIDPDTGMLVYKNGALADPETKQIVGWKNGLSSEQAREMQRKRYELARDAFSGGMRDAKPGRKSDMEAWSDIGTNLTRIASTTSGNAAVKAAQFIGRAAGLLPDRASSPAESESDDTLRRLGAAVAGRLVQMAEGSE